MDEPVKFGDAPKTSFARDLENTLHNALAEASRRHHEYATLEHLLLALTGDTHAVAVLKACAVDVEQLSADVTKYLDTELDPLKSDPALDPSPTASFQRVVQRAILHVQSARREEVTGANVLIALFSERESQAVFFLQQHDMTRLDAVSFFTHGITKAPQVAEPVSSDVDDDSRPKSFDFFLSYASSDSDIAREVFDVVKGAGYSITAQFQDFGAGANFVREMQHALATSAKLIAIYSPAYERSDHCQAEWSAAYNEDPGGLKRKIVAFMFQPTALNLLARQIVYTSLIGFNKTRRANAVLQAIGYKIPLRSKREIAREVARVASPDVEFRAGRLNAIPNRKLDISNRDTGVAELSLTLSQIAGIIIESLPGNTPPIVSKCLIVYKKNLDEYENGPILGVLNVAAAAVEREYRGQDSALWGPGLDGLISELFRIHGLFVANFPKDSERERLFSEISVDDSLIANGTIEENVAKASDALAKIANEGLTTPTFDRIVKDLKDQAEQIYFDPQIVQNKGFFGVSARQRLVLGTIGFYERILSALGNVAKIADSPTMVHAISVVRQAVENLLKLLS